jgi:hypothetical protein
MSPAYTDFVVIKEQAYNLLIPSEILAPWSTQYKYIKRLINMNVAYATR